jgi:hypothetical protein
MGSSLGNVQLYNECGTPAQCNPKPDYTGNEDIDRSIQ